MYENVAIFGAFGRAILAPKWLQNGLRIDIQQDPAVTLSRAFLVFGLGQIDDFGLQKYTQFWKVMKYGVVEKTLKFGARLGHYLSTEAKNRMPRVALK